MTESDISDIMASDPYLKPRKNNSEAEIRLYLREVNFHCPLCGKELQNRHQKKLSAKCFQIAHIFPNSPTPEQYAILYRLKRLGENSESFENKIALCHCCHLTFDHHVTKEEYIHLLSIKEKYLKDSALNDATLTLGLENEISKVIEKLTQLKENDFQELNYNPVLIVKKFLPSEVLLRTKVSNYVSNYYIYIRELFYELDGKKGFSMEVLCSQVKDCFLKMNLITDDKFMIFNHIVDWVKNRTLSSSQEACEAVVSFFIQNCEVFNEITK